MASLSQVTFLIADLTWGKIYDSLEKPLGILNMGLIFLVGSWGNRDYYDVKTYDFLLLKKVECCNKKRYIE